MFCMMKVEDDEAGSFFRYTIVYPFIQPCSLAHRLTSEACLSRLMARVKFPGISDGCNAYSTEPDTAGVVPAAVVAGTAGTVVATVASVAAGVVAAVVGAAVTCPVAGACEAHPAIPDERTIKNA